MERLACSRVADGEGLGKPDAAEKVLKAWIIAQGIKVGMHFKELQNIGLFLIEIADARVFGGIHFRTSCVLGNTLGRNYVSRHSMRALGDDQGDDEN